jgi:putative membrane protein insertion efficiency factor
MNRLGSALAIWLLKLYQATLSFDHGPLKRFFPYGYCRFHPTCSHYAIGSIERFGLIIGSWLAFKRLLRCHPWSQGGLDPVPDH